ncbi:MAG: ParB/RepB/Spo0J family partition protein [Oscillospiraceae bacterium]|jgi:ParB family chromosome partitioning protein|nr:ParB/RepB/Spo0J family partition protein [Oscillospiraceae bacterium]
MANKSGQTFELPKQSSLVADLFTTQEQRDNDKREKVMDIPLAEIDDFPDHPFQVKNDEAMQSMVESVNAVGVQTPAIARQKEDGRYELISGHRRKLAATLAGLETIPLIVRDLSRDEAIIAMVDANLQRETILPSEKALSYKMKLDAMKRQAGRPSQDNCSPLANNFKGIKTAAIIGETTGESKDQVYRYIRLTELIPQILQMVDDGKIALRPAVELSHLPRETQAELVDMMESEDYTPSHAQTIKMRKFAEEGRLNEDVIFSIMQEEKPNQKEQFKISRDKLSKYFAPSTPPQKMEEIIIKALELWRQRERNRDAR